MSDYEPNPPQNIIKANSPEVNSQTLADYLPGGELYKGKNIANSNVKKLLNGLAKKVTRAEEKIVEVVDEHDLSRTIEFITDWEKALGIPDDCFDPHNQTLDDRRRYAIAKLAKMNLTNRQDFIDLAAFFDINVTIESGSKFASVFPMTFPIIFGTKGAKFTMIVTFIDINKPENVFPMIWPFKFGSIQTAFIQCLFLELRPANVQILWRYADS